MPIRFQADADLNQIIQTTMPRHFGGFVQAQRSPGLLVVPQHLALRQVADDVILIWTATEPDEWVDRVVFLPI